MDVHDMAPDFRFSPVYQSLYRVHFYFTTAYLGAKSRPKKPEPSSSLRRLQNPGAAAKSLALIAAEHSQISDKRAAGHSRTEGATGFISEAGCTEPVSLFTCETQGRD